MSFPFNKNIKALTVISMLTAVCALASFSTQASNYQKMYKWVDHKGSTHYTLTPPPANAKKVGDVMTYNDTPSGSSAPTSTQTYQSAESLPSNNNNPQSSNATNIEQATPSQPSGAPIVQ